MPDTSTTFPLPIGATIPTRDGRTGGTVEALTLTSYRIVTWHGQTAFVPFSRVHPLAPATPLAFG